MMFLLYQLIALFVTVSSVSLYPLSEDTKTYTSVVQLKSGKVRGFVHEVEEGVKVNFYQGIRYGHYKRRFELAEPYTWSGVYDATHQLDACPQPGKTFNSTKRGGFETESTSEDCLYVNVFQPTTQKTNRTVMFWIHGGTYTTGTIFSLAYDGTYLAHMGDVVVVSVNYRLGPFGFLYSDDESSGSPGNQGLHDQILALKWVRDNIEYFGGNPNDVTIFGESAGSMSVGALYLSPLAKGLYHRAIMQSGAPNAYLGSIPKTEGLRRTNALIEELNCKREKLSESIDCLRGKTVPEILEVSQNALVNGELTIPVYGEQLLPDPPVAALKSGKFNKADLMVGINRNEGSSFVGQFINELNPDIKHPNLTIEKTVGFINILMMVFKEPFGAEVSQYYTKNLDGKDIDAMRIAIADVFGDYHLVCPTILFAEEVAKSVSTNQLSYAYRLMQPLTTIDLFHCHGWMGVCHGEDVIYLFGLPLRLRGFFTEEETQLSHDMVLAWAEFAKTGKISKIGGVEWNRSYTTEDPYVRLMELKVGNYKMVPDFFKDKCDTFWKPKIFK